MIRSASLPFPARRPAAFLTFAATVSVLLVGSAGCGGRPSDQWTRARPATFPATGLVRFEGKPVEGATVIFFAESRNIAATATTGPDGRFSLRTFDPGDGAILGRHAVTIDKSTEVLEIPKDPEAPPPPPKITRHLPERYADRERSGLSAEMTESGPNEFAFDLER
jgi:hypothetical protein